MALRDTIICSTVEIDETKREIVMRLLAEGHANLNWLKLIFVKSTARGLIVLALIYRVVSDYAPPIRSGRGGL